MVVVDLIDDLEMTRQDILEHGDGPALECLRQHSVVGVSEHFGADAPSLSPSQTFQVQEDAHQLRDSHRRMGVVQLDSHLKNACNIINEAKTTQMNRKL